MTDLRAERRPTIDGRTGVRGGAMTRGAAALAFAPAPTDPAQSAPATFPDRPARPPRRHLDVAPNPHRGSRLARFLVAVGIAATVVCLFVIVAANVVMAQQSYELDRVRAQQQDAQRSNAELRSEVARLSSPSRIVTEAERLGMIPATDFGFVQSTGAHDAPVNGDAVAETLRDTAEATRAADDSTP